MAVNGSGAILNISSMAAGQALSGVMGYSIAKAGIENFTRWLSVDLARRYGQGIRVNAIAPGFIKTDMTEELNEKELTKMIPAQRFGTAEEVAAVVGFLASKEAGYITGQVISVNGGLYS